MASDLIVAMIHEKRRFVENVDFVTSTGFWHGGTSRVDAGLITGGPAEVVTDLAILGFDEETKRMKVQALHDGVSADQVRDSTGFEILFDDNIEITEPPTDDELAGVEAEERSFGPKAIEGETVRQERDVAVLVANSETEVLPPV